MYMCESLYERQRLGEPASRVGEMWNCLVGVDQKKYQNVGDSVKIQV